MEGAIMFLAVATVEDDKNDYRGRSQPTVLRYRFHNYLPSKRGPRDSDRLGKGAETMSDEKTREAIDPLAGRNIVRRWKPADEQRPRLAMCLCGRVADEYAIEQGQFMGKPDAFRTWVRYGSDWEMDAVAHRSEITRIIHLLLEESDSQRAEISCLKARVSELEAMLEAKIGDYRRLEMKSRAVRNLRDRIRRLRADYNRAGRAIRIMETSVTSVGAFLAISEMAASGRWMDGWECALYEILDKELGPKEGDSK
jgi:hypothetical protein